MNVLDDFIMQAIAGLASYKCNLVPKDIYRLRMQDFQNAVAVLKSCRLKKKYLIVSQTESLQAACGAILCSPKWVWPAFVLLCRALGEDRETKVLRSQ